MESGKNYFFGNYSDIVYVADFFLSPSSQGGTTFLPLAITVSSCAASMTIIRGETESDGRGKKHVRVGHISL